MHAIQLRRPQTVDDASEHNLTTRSSRTGADEKSAGASLQLQVPARSETLLRDSQQGQPPITWPTGSVHRPVERSARPQVPRVLMNTLNAKYQEPRRRWTLCVT